MKITDASEFLKLAGDIDIIDVRSPSEFLDGHIPGAHNLPLFNDEERAIVGTLYKNSGREASVLRGLELVGPKLSDFVKQARKISPNHQLLVHCWRGGLRSKNMAWLLEIAGFDTMVLEGGYKAYRRFIRQELGEMREYIILGGKTGSGKSDILQALKSRGEQVIDLEGLAHHKGSAFGDLGQEHQPTNEQFENNLFEEWKRLDANRPIWLEDESRGIGKVSIPDTLFENMRKSTTLFIDVPKEIRVKRLVNEYAGFNQKKLIAAVERITTKLGGLNAKLAIEAIYRDDYETVVDLLLVYYDKSYLKGLHFRDAVSVFTLNSETGDPDANAVKLQHYYKEHLSKSIS